MLISTTSTLEERKIKEYRGIVFGEVVTGIDYLKDFYASVSNVVGGRVEDYEQELIDGRATAISKMMEKAKTIGANALIGVKIDIEPITIGKGFSMFIITATGTAVVIE